MTPPPPPKKKDLLHFAFLTPKEFGGGGLGDLALKIVREPPPPKSLKSPQFKSLGSVYTVYHTGYRQNRPASSAPPPKKKKKRKKKGGGGEQILFIFP